MADARIRPDAKSWARPGRGGGLSRRLALQALAGVWTAGRARGQAYGRPVRRWRGIGGVGNQETGAVQGLVVQAAVADGRSRRGARFAVGATVEVCCGVNQAGFVSMWSSAADGELTRIVPNRHTPSGAEGAPVRAGRKCCVGEDGILPADDGETVVEGSGQYRLEVREPVGSSSLLLYWTTEEEQQPAAELALDIDGLDAAIKQRRGGSGKHRGQPAPEALEAEFEIVSGGEL